MTHRIRRSAAPPRRRLAASIAALLLVPLAAAAQGGTEEQAARYFDAIRGDSTALEIFVREMPKGGDLHSHLSGAIYAESYLRWAAEDGLCVNTARLAILYEGCTPSDTLRPASQIADTSALYARLVDAMSMRNWDSTRISGSTSSSAPSPASAPPTAAAATCWPRPPPAPRRAGCATWS